MVRIIRFSEEKSFNEALAKKLPKGLRSKITSYIKERAPYFESLQEEVLELTLGLQDLLNGEVNITKGTIDDRVYLVKLGFNKSYTIGDAEALAAIAKELLQIKKSLDLPFSTIGLLSDLIEFNFHFNHNNDLYLNFNWLGLWLDNRIILDR